MVSSFLSLALRSDWRKTKSCENKRSDWLRLSRIESPTPDSPWSAWRFDRRAREKELQSINVGGLIGSALARRLEAQYEVICFDREGAPHPPAECDCANCDIMNCIVPGAPGNRVTVDSEQ